ncbi:MAG: hypothetical protein JWP29_3521 [Rhodoferax sp.]|nr:hypothetical protein [Rhodoferax sp.]
MTALLAGPALWTAIAAVVIAGLGIAYYSAKRTGAQEVENADLKKMVANAQARQDVDSGVAAASDAGVADELRRDWTRKS